MLIMFRDQLFPRKLLNCCSNSAGQRKFTKDDGQTQTLSIRFHEGSCAYRFQSIFNVKHRKKRYELSKRDLDKLIKYLTFYVTEANNSLHKTYTSIVVILFTDFRGCFLEKTSKFGCYCSENYIKLVRIISIAEVIEIGDIFRDEMKPSLYFHEHK